MTKEVIVGIIISLLTIGLLTSIYFNVDQDATIKDQQGRIASLSNQLTNTQSELSTAKSNVTKLTNTVNQKENIITSLKNQITNLGGQIQSLATQVSDYAELVQEQEEQLISSSQKIQELSALTEAQQQQLNQLVSTFSLTGTLIQESYGGSLVLYDDAATYTAKSPLFAQIKDDPEKYYKLGIPFFYFKNSTKLTEQEQIILGEYSGLYDYIFIYNDTTQIKTIYHEIAHIIYKIFFKEIPENKAMWEDYYNFLKEHNYLSSDYAYTSPEEGFAEEYAYYQTKENPNQHHQMNIFMDPLNDWLKS